MLLEKIQRANSIDISLFAQLTIEICQFAHPHRFPNAHPTLHVDKIGAMLIKQVRVA